MTNAESTSNIGMIVAFVVAGVVVLFSVLLMIRQRVKEIGILKAIGASNWRIGLQFSLETLAVSVVGAIIGALITYPSGSEGVRPDGRQQLDKLRGGPGGGFRRRPGRHVRRCRREHWQAAMWPYRRLSSSTP